MLLFVFKQGRIQSIQSFSIVVHWTEQADLPRGIARYTSADAKREVKVNPRRKSTRSTKPNIIVARKLFCLHPATMFSSQITGGEKNMFLWDAFGIPWNTGLRLSFRTRIFVLKSVIELGSLSWFEVFCKSLSMTD